MLIEVINRTEAIEVPSASLKQLTFSGGDEIELLPNDKVLIVGANNSGKSKAIREIIGVCSESDRFRDLVVLRSVEIDKRGGQDAFDHFVRDRGRLINDNFVIGDWSLSMYAIQYWQRPYLTHGICQGFVRNLTANNRLSICEQQSSIAPSDPASRPQHLLYRNDALMARISGLFKQAFGSELMIDFLGGSKIPIHVGVKPQGTGFEDRASTRYSEAVNAQPALDQQGDGMKSYAGILFETVASKRDVTFIDEPEAFLHPPQMRRLGETLSQHVEGQLVVATHSSDILRGFLEGRKGNVRILRIHRDGGVNRIYEASASVIESLWKTPVLRFSNALEAIFHDQAIICEDDSDCRLLSSVADYIQASNNETWADTAYVPMGGKAGIPKVAKVLREVGVPVKAVFDFDLISEGNRLRETVEAFGGDWDKIGELWMRVSSAVLKLSTPTAEQIKDEVRAIIEKSAVDELPRKDVDEAFRRKSQWAAVKRHGLDGLPRGQVRQECEQMMDLLEQLGVYLVPGGEMESFCPTIGGHGPKFVTEVLTEMPLNSTSLSSLRDFTIKVHAGPHATLSSIGTIKERRDREARNREARRAGETRRVELPPS